MNVSGPNSVTRTAWEHKQRAKFSSVYKSPEFSLQKKSADLHQVRISVEGISLPSDNILPFFF